MAVDSRLLSGAEDGKVTFWEVMSPVPLCQMRAHDLAVTAVAVREDGKGMVTAGAEGTAKSWTVDGDVPT